MDLFLLLILLLIAVVLFLKSIVMIPTACFGVVVRFGRRTGRILHEGINLRLPLIEVVQSISMELDTTPIDTTFFTRDNLELSVVGSLQWAPTHRICDEIGRNRFLDIDKRTIAKGITDAIESELGKLGSVEKAESFIVNRDALEVLLNCILRLDRLPHEKEGIQAEALISYYKDNKQRITEHLRSHKKNVSHDFSAIERRYGIEIVAFILTRIAFSDTTKDALEKQGQAIVELAAVDERMGRIEVFARRLRSDHGLGHQEAVNTAKLLIGMADNKIVSFEGLDKLGLNTLLKALER